MAAESDDGAAATRAEQPNDDRSEADLEEAFHREAKKVCAKIRCMLRVSDKSLVAAPIPSSKEATVDVRRPALEMVPLYAAVCAPDTPPFVAMVKSVDSEFPSSSSTAVAQVPHLKTCSSSDLSGKLKLLKEIKVALAEHDPQTSPRLLELIDILESFAMTDDLLRASKVSDSLARLQRELKQIPTEKPLAKRLKRLLQSWKQIHTTRKALDAVTPYRCQMGIGHVERFDCRGHHWSGRVPQRSEGENGAILADLVQAFPLQDLMSDTGKVLKEHKSDNLEYQELQQLISTVGSS